MKIELGDRVIDELGEIGVVESFRGGRPVVNGKPVKGAEFYPTPEQIRDRSRLMRERSIENPDKTHCALCGAEFEKLRRDSFYCSRKCRTKASWRRRNGWPDDLAEMRMRIEPTVPAIRFIDLSPGLGRELESE